MAYGYAPQVYAPPVYAPYGYAPRVYAITGVTATAGTAMRLSRPASAQTRIVAGAM
jgi:hypothetical protein